jgi:Zn-dependent M28 family amino/carboxypeptidase
VNARMPSPFVIDSADTEGAYCRSDHWSYARYGIPIVFLTTGAHADYHAVSDEAAYVDYAKLTAVSQLTAALVQALGDRGDRLSVSGPKPDPRAFCRG